MPINTVVPKQQVFAVYCVDKNGKPGLYVEPILFFIVKDDMEILSVPLGGENILVAEDLESECGNFLGYSLEQEPDIKDWTEEINRYRKRRE